MSLLLLDLLQYIIILPIKESQLYDYLKLQFNQIYTGFLSRKDYFLDLQTFLSFQNQIMIIISLKTASKVMAQNF